MMRTRIARPVLLALLLGATAAAAQQLYRWTDERGRVHITDTPPPASAKGVQRKSYQGGGSAAAPTSYELSLAMKQFPVTLYTAPICKEPCQDARAALNRRGVPFKEIQVHDEATTEELKRVSGSNEVPTLLVGRSVHRGFDPAAYEALLDSARYPRIGILPARAQAAPAPPEGYVAPGEAPKAEPAAPSAAAEETPQPTGPYAPGAPPQRR
jgi:glutaredoxin